MGTEITLDVAGLTLTYSKNFVGMDHGMLFQEKDRQREISDQIDYDWHHENHEDPAPMEMAFSRTLKDVVPRLELLGFTLDHARRDYARQVELWREERESLRDEKDPQEFDALSFEEFCAFATAHPIESLDDSFSSDAGKKGERKTKGRFSDEKVTDRIPRLYDQNDTTWSERSYFGSLVAIIHPYSALRILAQNSENLEGKVLWQYGPLIDAGWAKTSDFIAGARRTQTFLIATEGSSDSHILSHAFELLKPEVADFFRFIDVSEGHPFSGTGNLRKFAEGLAKIDVHNQAIFLFDNDAEGFEAHQKVLSLNLPPNMHSMLLPDLDVFRTFPALGPDGVKVADINNRAAAIECYLDLSMGNYQPPKVVWTNYKKDLGVYQGALEFKESYVKRFLGLTAESLAAGSYDASKMLAVLDAVVRECTTMAMKSSVLNQRPNSD